MCVYTACFYKIVSLAYKILLVPLVPFLDNVKSVWKISIHPLENSLICQCCCKCCNFFSFISYTPMTVWRMHTSIWPQVKWNYDPGKCENHLKHWWYWGIKNNFKHVNIYSIYYLILQGNVTLQADKSLLLNSVCCKRVGLCKFLLVKDCHMSCGFQFERPKMLTVPWM